VWPTARDWLVGAALIAFATAVNVLLMATSDFPPDIFKSPLYWWSWIAFPAAGAVAGYFRGTRSRPIWWSACLTLPGVLTVGLGGTVFYDSNLGVSFWPIGEMFVIVLGGLAGVAATVGASVNASRRREALR
jgi:hypothetical protein